MTIVESKTTTPRRPRPVPAGDPASAVRVRPNPRHSMPEGGADEPPRAQAGTADGGAAHAAGAADVVQAGSRFRARAAPAALLASDYRLRGLDLGTSAVAEASRPAVPTTNIARRRQRRRLLGQFAAVLVVTALVGVLLRAWVVEPYMVRSTAMVPNIEPGTEVLVTRPGWLAGSPGVGDVVVVREPKYANCARGSHVLVQRVIGLPGQTIWSDARQIYLDGRVLKESGWYNPPFGEVGPALIPPTTIPAGSYFLLGDNRTDRCDSRAFGPVRRTAMIGEVVASIARNGHPYVHGL